MHYKNMLKFLLPLLHHFGLLVILTVLLTGKMPKTSTDSIKNLPTANATEMVQNKDKSIIWIPVLLSNKKNIDNFQEQNLRDKDEEEPKENKPNNQNKDKSRFKYFVNWVGTSASQTYMNLKESFLKNQESIASIRSNWWTWPTSKSEFVYIFLEI